MKPILLVTAFALLLPVPALADMKIALGAPWTGKAIPAGQQCKLDGGNGGTPPLSVTGLPAGTVQVVVAFNDRNYPPLSKNGGHGTIGFPVKGDSASLPAVPGMTAKLPGGARVVAKAKSTGNYASPGYLPPCSGGKGHRYTADVMAVGADGKVIEKKTIDIGRY